ncbi:MAG: hypothetical protein V4653_15385 [Pseudomonadota bacterium]
MSEAFDAAGAYASAELPSAYVALANLTRWRFATAGYLTDAGEVPASTAWLPGMLGDVDLSASSIDALAIGGRVALLLAEISLSDRGRLLGDVVRYGTATGRAAMLRVLPVANARSSNFGAPLASARGAFTGVVRAMEEEAGFRVRVALSDLAERLATPLQATLYAGTGGIEGAADLKGRPKPLAFGEAFNVPATYLGQADLGAGTLPTYQTHAREIAGHDAVRVRGVAQSATAGTPTVGQYRDFPALGMFQLGSTADGEVTADLRGDSPSGDYVNSIASIVYRLLSAFGPQLTGADLDAGAFAFAELDLPGVVGFFQGPEATTAAVAVEVVLASAGAILVGCRDGRLRLVDPLGAAPVVQFSISAAWMLSCEPLPLPLSLRPAPRAVEVGYRRNWRPLTGVAGSVPEADRERLQQTGGTARAESTTVTGRVALQRTTALPGLYAIEADALARATIWRDWIERGPRVIRFETDRYLDQIEVGQFGRIEYPAHRLHTGFSGVVLAWRERLAARRVEITMVGVPD